MDCVQLLVKIQVNLQNSLTIFLFHLEITFLVVEIKNFIFFLVLLDFTMELTMSM